MSDEHPPIFQGEYRHRNPTTLLFAAAIFALGTFKLFFFAYVLVYRKGLNPQWLGGKQMPQDALWVFSFVAPIVGVIALYAAYRIAKAAIDDSASEIEISLDGIILGDSSYDWEHITWIAGQRRLFRPTRFMIAFRHYWGGVITLPVTPPLERSAVNELLNRIADEVAPQHPDLEVHGIASILTTVRLPPAPQ